MRWRHQTLRQRVSLPRSVCSLSARAMLDTSGPTFSRSYWMFSMYSADVVHWFLVSSRYSLFSWSAASKLCGPLILIRVLLWSSAAALTLICTPWDPATSLRLGRYPMCVLCVRCYSSYLQGKSSFYLIVTILPRTHAYYIKWTKGEGPSWLNP